jgi:hypothetical protein
MGLFRRRQDDAAGAVPWEHDPVTALRQAQDALARTRTQLDQHGRRRAIDPTTRARMEDALARAAEAAEAARDDTGRD